MNRPRTPEPNIAIATVDFNEIGDSKCYEGWDVSGVQGQLRDARNGAQWTNQSRVHGLRITIIKRAVYFVHKGSESRN